MLDGTIAQRLASAERWRQVSFPEKPFEIPSDNLYKFVALFGLALVLGSSYVGVTAHFEHVRLWSELVVELEQLEATRAEEFHDAGEIEHQITKIQTVVSDLRKSRGSVDQNAARAAVEQVSAKLDAAESSVPGLAARSTATTKSAHDLGKRIHLGKSEVEHTSALLKLCLVAFCLGMIVGVSGFWLWYHRVQKFLDLRLRREAVDR